VQVEYEGDFMNDQRDGLGTGYLGNGAVFKGLWKLGKMHGKVSKTESA
jgi:hypothetical protein